MIILHVNIDLITFRVVCQRNGDHNFGGIKQPLRGLINRENR